MSKVNRRRQVLVGACIGVALLILGSLAVVWFVPPGDAAGRQSGTAKASGTEPDPREQAESVNPAEPVEIIVMETDGEHFELAVHWVGPSSGSVIEVGLKDFDAPADVIATARLDGSKLVCPVPGDGRYVFDFAAAGVYSLPYAVHHFSVVDGEVHQVLLPGYIHGALPVSLGARVKLVAALETPPRGEHIEITCSPLNWPGRFPPQLDLALTFGAEEPLLLPAQGIEFSIRSEGFEVLAPNPHRFTPLTDGDRLEISLRRLIPVIVHVSESTHGTWRQLILDSTEAERSRLPVEEHDSAQAPIRLNIGAADSAGRQVRGFSRGTMFGRTLEAIDTQSGYADTFTFYAPEPADWISLTAMLNMHGGGLIAYGTAVANQGAREVHVFANMIETTDLHVQIVTEDGTPVAGVPVSVRARYLYPPSGRYSVAVGISQRRESDEEGRLVFPGLPAGEQLVANLSLSGGFSVVDGATQVELKQPGRTDFVVTLRSADRRMLRVDFEGGTDCTIVVVEGDGQGTWHRKSTHQASNTLSVSVRSDYVFVTLRRGDAIFSETAWTREPLTVVEFSSTTANPVTGKIPVEGESELLLFPYDADPALVWGAATGSSALPSIRVGADRKFECRPRLGLDARQWYAASPDGQLFLLRIVGVQSVSARGSVTLTAEEVQTSTVEITVSKAQLEGASRLSVIVTPVYATGGRSLEWGSRLGTRIDVDSEGRASIDLPPGRYMAMLTGVSNEGARWFGTAPGRHAPFESRPGHPTHVHLR
jgi:hypothetical protein